MLLKKIRQNLLDWLTQVKIMTAPDPIFF